MSTTGDELRIGDAEREHVRDLLERHAADGRLTLDELSERMVEVYAARTAPDLRHALRELPALPGGGPPPAGLAPIEPPGPPFAAPVQWGRGGWGPPVAPVLALAVLGIWLVVAATTGFWFFPFWPFLFFFLVARRSGGWDRGRRGGWGGLGPPRRGWDGPEPRSGGTRYV